MQLKLKKKTNKIMPNQIQIPCPQCQTQIPIETKQLIMGVKFNCPNSNCDASIGLAEESKPIVSETLEKLDSIKNHITHK